MIAEISKKVIISFFLFINFIQPSKSGEELKINKNHNNTKSNWLKKTNKIASKLSNGNFNGTNTNKNILKKNLETAFVNSSEKQKELVIQSDKQSEVNGVIYADGNVSVSYRGIVIKADNLIYDKSDKTISSEGNISLIIGEQIFEISQIKYSFITEKGYLLDLKGLLNTNKLMDDLLSNFSSSDIKNIEDLLELKKKRVIHTPGRVENWIISADKMIIDKKTWKSKQAILSNDLLELKQVKLVINSLEVIPKANKLRFKSSLNYLIFDEKVSIPFWLGGRTLTNYGDSFKYENRWNLGYENFDKDGYFIGRKFNPIDISDDFVLELEPQFLIQRSLKGYTNSFVKKGDSITAEKVKDNASFEDFFALKSQIKGEINNWDLEIDKNLNSLNFDKFPEAFRFKTTLSKEINFLDSKWEKSFYGIYRERVWNGSLGESEIYSGYGSNLQKENTWFVNGIKNTELLSFGLANITAEALNTKNLLSNLKGNFFYSFDQKIPILVEDLKNKSIDISYRYIPQPITKGLIFNTRLQGSYSFYENGDHQEYLGLGMGPELVFGSFKNKYFDYTRLSVFPFYKFNNGESVFKFDQNLENFTLDIALDQQLMGPLILKSMGTLNLTNDSDNYGEFIDSKISLSWKKRSYEFGIFYQPHNQSGGISFDLFGFQ